MRRNLKEAGGKIKVTAKMRRFFWAMYYKNTGAIKKAASGKQANTARNKRLSAEAAMWKGMALKPVGSVITIPARPFIGNHPQVEASIQRVFAADVKDLEEYMNTIFKKR